MAAFDANATGATGRVASSDRMTVGAEDRMLMRGDVPRYSAGTEVTLAGTVERDAAYMARTRTAGMLGARVIIDAGGDRAEVVLGPSWFVDAHDLRLHVGDAVRVTGARVARPGLDLVIAREVEYYGLTVLLRESDGTPRWGRAAARA